MKKALFSILIFLIIYQYSNAEEDKFSALNKKTLHIVGIFAGGSSIFQDGITGFAMNANYEYRYTRSHFGFGFTAEFLFSDLTEMLFCVPFNFHDLTPLNLKFTLGPGVALTKRILYFRPSSNFDPKEVKNETNTNNFFFRFGLGWERIIYRDNIPMIIFTPQIGADVMSESKIYFNYGIYLTWIIK